MAFLGTAHAGVRWNFTAEFGDLRAVILDEAKLSGADILALGTKGRTGHAREFVGGVTAIVIHGAPRMGDTPVLVVRDCATRPCRGPLVATELADSWRREIERALRLITGPANIRIGRAFHVRTVVFLVTVDAPCAVLLARPARFSFALR